MDATTLTMAQQIAQAASAFEEQRTGMVQVFLLAHGIAAETWRGNGQGNRS